MTQVARPYHFDHRGRTGDRDRDDHARDLIEAVLFTAPGERVNRPTFGSGLGRLVFDPNSREVAAATQLLVQGALQQWLGDLIRVSDVTVDSDDATLRVQVAYELVADGMPRVDTFSQGGERGGEGGGGGAP